MVHNLVFKLHQSNVLLALRSRLRLSIKLVAKSNTVVLKNANFHLGEEGHVLNSYKAFHFSDLLAAVPKFFVEFSQNRLSKHKALVLLDVSQANKVTNQFLEIYVALSY